MSDREIARSVTWTALAAFVVVLLWALRDVMVLVGLAALLAYALDPLVTGLERLRVPRLGALPRAFAAGLVMLALVALGVWAAIFAAPRLAHQIGRFLDALPANLDSLVGAWSDYAARYGVATLQDGGGGAPLDAAGLMKQLGAALTAVAGRLFGNLGQLLGLVLVPVLALYLLAEREAVQLSAMGFLPVDARARAERMGGAVDRALRSYVRGQSVVCLTMGTTVGFALQLLGFPVALLLGVIVGIAEAVPFLGYLTAALAIGLAGYGASPRLALTGVVAYAILNQVIGLLVTPRVMGRHMKMHPFVITVSILAGATLLGAGGAVLALPAAAAAQSLIRELTVGARDPDASL